MSRADIHLQHSVMGMLGSFWSRVVTSKAQAEARAIATQSTNAPGLRRLEMPVRKLLSERASPVENVRVPFLEGDFVFIGPDMVAGWRSEFEAPAGTAFRIVRRDLSDPVPRSQLLLGSNGRPLGENLGGLLSVFASEDGMTGMESLYVLPLPPGLNPIVIATRDEDRHLVQGIDFETGPGYMVMRESPGQTFFAGGFTVVYGTQAMRLPYSYTMQINGDAYGHAFVAAYYRGACSLASFERAAAQAAGLLVLEQDDTLVSASPLASPVAEITRYVFLKAGAVDVSYPHRKLTPGSDYAKGTIVSNGFRVVGAGGEGWLRRAADGRTLSLDGVLSVANLYLPHGLTTAYQVETGAGGKPHARLQLIGSPSDLLALWSLQKNHELRHGEYLATQIGMNATEPRVSFDMHGMLESFYGNHLLLVLPELTGAPANHLSRLLEFVRREKPLGAAVLVAAEPTNLDPPGTWAPAGALVNDVYGYTPTDHSVIPDGALVYQGDPLAYEGEILVYVGP